MTVKSRILTLVTLSTLLAATPLLAQENKTSKHRSVTARTPGAAITAVVSGVVRDAVTGAVVVNADVTAGRRHITTDEQGKFTIPNADGFGEILLDVQRSGYQVYRTKLAGAGPHVLTISVQPTATITVKKTDGTSTQVDYEDIKFGFPVVFVGFRGSPSAPFCLANGSVTEIHKSAIKRIIGPGTSSAAGCCSAGGLKVTLELKTGGTTDAWFIDSCGTENTMELAGTEHVSGARFDLPFKNISEVIFP
jgi:hypothetical protein